MFRAHAILSLYAYVSVMVIISRAEGAPILSSGALGSQCWYSSIISYNTISLDTNHTNILISTITTQQQHHTTPKIITLQISSNNGSSHDGNSTESDNTGTYVMTWLIFRWLAIALILSILLLSYFIFHVEWCLFYTILHCCYHIPCRVVH